MKPRVAILGAGISGLTTAVVFAERGFEPVIFADQMSADTTSAVAAAIWFPYDATPEHLVTAWALITYGRLLELAREPDTTGVSLIEFRVFSRNSSVDVPPWAEVLGYRLLHDAELGDHYHAGYSLTVPLMETPIYLPYMEQRAMDAGGSFAHIDSLASIDELPKDNFDVIVNCSGYGARDLVSDEAVEGHRGQVVVVPKIDRSWAMVCAEPLTYVIPRQDGCVLGGVNTESWSRTIDPESTATILRRCHEEGVDGEPKNPPPVGIRPFRKIGVRLETDLTADGRLVIHNYGHGGCGLSLSWGCAHKVFELAQISRGSA
jgi:D-amino-acid oxidase